jgi:DGQHR domain-containing protein
MTPSYRFTAIGARQASTTRVFTFTATAKEILATCEISRLGRTEEGELFGFQRPQVANHIQEIRDYLVSKDAVLPNAIVIGLLGGVRVKPLGRRGLFELTISPKDRKTGFVVDGQQRLTALAQTNREDFEVFVSCVICDTEEELRRQFILINNTRPLPKSLIYELLPEVDNLPKRLTSRAFAAALVERLNSDPRSSVRGLVNTHTNPAGPIKDTSLHRVIMNSADSGAIRDFGDNRRRMDFGFELLSTFYGAVAETFPKAWHGHNPRTSRLVHGAGVVAMGYVMETIYSRSGQVTHKNFARGLQPLLAKCAWTEGRWRFEDRSVLSWDEIENTPRQIQRLALHLIGLIKRRRPGRERNS